MNHKVLLADDSLTIQKVIKITLANQPYDITECSTDEELLQKLPSIQPRIVFLDFNLSEKYSGYELTSKIKSICPGTKVLLLLGTFDTVDDAALEKCGASDKIVKPFDSNKFIAICKQLIKISADDDSEDEAVLPKNDDLEMPEAEDQWQMGHGGKSFEEVRPEPRQEIPVKLNALSQEISEWGMSVPNVISAEPSGEIRIDLPPVIGATAEKPVESHKAHDVKFPETGDLDYPTIEEMRPRQEVEARPRQTAQLISLKSFKDKPQELEIQGNYVEDVADVSSIEAQIRDEVEEDLWHADEFEDLKREVSSKIEEMKNEFTPSRADFDESLFKPIDEGESLLEYQGEEPKFSASVIPKSPDFAEMRTEVEAMVKRYVQEYMDEMFRKNVEKISWEVIPDLAENLIRQELGKISAKIINE